MLLRTIGLVQSTATGLAIVASVVVASCGGGGGAIQATIVHPSPTPLCTAPCLAAEYQIPTSGSGPTDISIGYDGDLWFTERHGNKIAEVTTAGTFTEYPDSNGGPFGLARGPSTDGNLWFIDGGTSTISNITTIGVITSFHLTPPCNPPYCYFHTTSSDIAAGPDGDLWFIATLHVIGGHEYFYVDTMTTGGMITNRFKISTSGDRIALGHDNNLWFTESNANQIGRITTSGAVTEFPIPTADCGPGYITAGPDGNVWFIEFQANKIGMITPAGVITEFSIPTASSDPHVITAGPDGNLWFTEKSGNKLGRITTSGVITEFPLTRALSGPDGITTGPDGNLWFTESGLHGNRIGKFVP